LGLADGELKATLRVRLPGQWGGGDSLLERERRRPAAWAGAAGQAPSPDGERAGGGVEEEEKAEWVEAPSSRLPPALQQPRPADRVCLQQQSLFRAERRPETQRCCDSAEQIPTSLYLSFWFWLPYIITLQILPFILLSLNQLQSTAYR